MKSRTLLIALAACLVALSTACATASSKDPTPTVEPTPSPLPITLYRQDPNSDPEGFLAALPQGEVACAEGAVGGHDRLVQLVSYENHAGDASTNGEVSAIVGCMSDLTARGVLVGQVDRMAGGLSDETIACMTGNAAGVALEVILSSGSTTEADAYLSLVRTIFCLDTQERTALETNAGETFGFQRVGFIDSLQCAFDYRDADGNPVIDQVAQFIASQSSGEFDLSTADGQEMLASLFRFIPAGVECGLITDEDFANSGLTAEQFACVSREGGDALISLITSVDGSASASPDLGQLAGLLNVLDKCGVSLDQVLAASGSSGGDGGTADATPQPIPTASVSPMEALQGILPQEQYNCLAEHLAPEDIDAAMNGEFTSGLFDALDACGIDVTALFSQ